MSLRERRVIPWCADGRVFFLTLICYVLKTRIAAEQECLLTFQRDKTAGCGDVH